jgi:hypothetical protein
MTFRRKNTIERACFVGMGVGIVGLVQPFALPIYHLGFLILLVSVMTFIVVSHLAVRS